MQLFNKWEQVWDNKDARAFLDMHHAEFEFHFHSNGRILKRVDMSVDMVAGVMSKETIKNRRCIYENDKILVIHQFNEVAVNGRSTRVAHLEQPVFAWK